MVFNTSTIQIVAVDFTKVESGVITLTRSHHDRPMGETIYLFRCEEDQEMLDEEQVLTKLKELDWMKKNEKRLELGRGY